MPSATAIDVDGLDPDAAALNAAPAVDTDHWGAELPLVEDRFATVGDKLPDPLRAALDDLRNRLRSHA